MDDVSTLSFLGGLQRMGINPGLENIKAVLRALDNPQFKFNSVLVAGTNGKGSTAAFLARILESSGYKAGLYTSPHLIDARERIRINGIAISEEDFERIGRELRRALETIDIRLTFFEAVTAIGFAYFAAKEIDVAVLEVGMGGRFDATNVVLPLVSVITNISIDHSKYLGSTVEDIAFEKGGIIHSGGDLVSGVSHGLYNCVLKPICERENVDSFLLGRDFSYSGFGGAWSFSGRKFELGGIALSLRGSFQGENAALACAAAECLAGRSFDISKESLMKGLSGTEWRGRFEALEENPLFIIDGAHNPGAYARLTETLS
ncbi:MAG: bifunctional folylpolyglutamate synthase/dihydrofolate synthase, partial [Deltaproteobacteria bacterium]|nr:bifunctional folylpolyglutamate synthase/dihydrofolate synthase [Deltaproteobacteria bacterium]